MSRKKRKPSCAFPGCAAEAMGFFCTDHWFLVSRPVQLQLSELRRYKAFAKVYLPGDDGKSLMDRARADIEKALANGAQLGAWRGKAKPRPVTKFLGNGRGDE